MSAPGSPRDRTGTETLSIDTTTVVGDVTVTASFTAGVGVTALFGPSGSGKSVTLATIAGLLRPTAGTVTIGGRRVADAASRHHVRTQDRRLGLVSQHGSLLPHRSPLDNVAVAVRGADRRARRERAREWLTRVGADDLATSSTATLSGGEQQRIALARALAGGPEVVLLDEPFTALDLPTRRSLRQVVRELTDREGLCTLIVTHDLEDVVELADRVVRFEPGRTVATHDLVGTDHGGEVARILGLTGDR